MSKKLCFIGTLSKESQALAVLLKPEAIKAGFDCFSLFPEDTDSEVYFKACLDSDVVVVDASIESIEDKVENIHYGNFNAMHIAFDHIIIVSRTYLPVNFTTLFRDIAPAYPYPKHHPASVNNIENEVSWVKGMENNEIVTQLTKRLSLQFQPALITRLPAMNEENLDHFFTVYTALMRESVERLKAETRKGKRKVFISYRSDYYKKIIEFIKS
jgi:hypothetical protein